MDLRRVDLNLLTAFDALLAERSVTKAAVRMCVGQSAMSATLVRLRYLFHDPLLVRQGRTMVPTPVAERLIEPVRRLLDQASDLLANVEGFDPATDARTYRVVASDYVTLVFLRPALRLLAQEAPHLRLEIRPLVHSFADELRRDDVDLLITPAEAFAQHRDFPHAPLFSDRYVLAMAKNHPHAAAGLTREAFEQAPYLAMTAGRPPTVIEQRLEEQGITPNTAISTSFILGLFMLEGTDLVTLVQERLALGFRDQLSLHLCDAPFPLGRITELMIWTRRQDGEPGHHWLRERLLAVANELFGQGEASG